MTDKERQRYRGENYSGPDHAAPYPVSRLAPATGLLDLAREIAAADTMLGNVTHARLRQIAEQIRHLQQEAHAILEASARDQQLHRAQCGFKKIPGRVYHLYQRGDGNRYFSMLAPSEWGDSPPHPFLGSYRLENDMSWTPLEQIGAEEESLQRIQSLIEGGERGV